MQKTGGRSILPHLPDGGGLPGTMLLFLSRRHAEHVGTKGPGLASAASKCWKQRATSGIYEFGIGFPSSRYRISNSCHELFQDPEPRRRYAGKSTQLVIVGGVARDANGAENSAVLVNYNDAARGWNHAIRP